MFKVTIKLLLIRTGISVKHIGFISNPLHALNRPGGGELVGMVVKDLFTSAQLLPKMQPSDRLQSGRVREINRSHFADANSGLQKPGSLNHNRSGRYKFRTVPI